MINIVLACQYGASTDLLAEKMKEAVKEEKLEVVINAYSFTKLDQVIDEADVVLLGPQIRFKKKSFENQFKDKGVKFLVIDPSAYGMLDGKKVLHDTLAELNK